ncbi:hypothetical protein DXX93_08875 [Thalassotalea euphylliae]|uniref:Lipocalin-like domain-containing protein n=1 Tax=Thalassotalea euphylliae TaxID=1655234 RepID=A0A3E0TQR9_9GAMM|nr:hypothetical protein [Thalassotalea euphylliae]REL26680.1 hypothetical protein DXX93_08875 [Thalassotalea euphylliae]
MKKLIVVLIFIASNSAAGNIDFENIECPELSYDSLIGKWYSEQKNDGDTYQRWLMHRFPNGTYKTTIEYSTLSTSEVTIEKHKGFWAYSKCLYSTQILEFNNEPYSMSTIYLVLDLDGHSFKYQSTATGTKYTITKVDNDFKL